jgi:CRP/FNR family transcriptional regulator
LSAPIPSRASFYVVIAGLVKLSTYVPDGRDQVLALVERGDLFGEFAPAETSVPMRAEAFDHRVVVGTVHRPVFEDILRNAPEIAMCVIRVLARRLRAAEQEIQDLALRNIRGRLASLLVRLAEEYGEPHNRGIRLSLRLTHHDLASMVGATRETASSAGSDTRSCLPSSSGCSSSASRDRTPRASLILDIRWNYRSRFCIDTHGAGRSCQMSDRRISEPRLEKERG